MKTNALCCCTAHRESTGQMEFPSVSFASVISGRAKTIASCYDDTGSTTISRYIIHPPPQVIPKIIDNYPRILIHLRDGSLYGFLEAADNPRLALCEGALICKDLGSSPTYNQEVFVP